MTKNAFGVLVLVGVLVTGCAGASPAPAASQPAATSASRAAATPTLGPEKTAVTIAHVGGLPSAPIILAAGLGYFKDEGVTASLSVITSGAASATAVQSGTLDFAVTNLNSVIQAQAQGGTIVQTFILNLVPGNVMLLPKGSTAKSIVDLKASPIGISSLGSITDVEVRTLFQRNGLDPNSAQAVGVGLGSTGVAALVNGRVQALVTIDPYATQLVQSGQATVLYDMRTIKGTQEVFGGYVPGAGVASSQAFVQANHRTVGAVSRALARALKYVQTRTPEEVTAALPAQDYYPDGNKVLFADMIRASKEMYSGDGTVLPDMPANALRSLTALDKTKDYSKVDLTKTYYNGWAK